MTDEELVKRITSGDTEAYRVLVERYEPRLTRYAVYLIHDSDTADDVVQDTFIKAYRNLKGFDTGLKFSSWIYRIAHNEAMNAIRSASRHKLLDDDQWESLVDESDSVEVSADRRLAGRKLAECLRELAPKYREAVALFFFEHRTYKEIGDILRMPVATVGVRINRAKKLLRQICEKKGITNEE